MAAVIGIIPVLLVTVVRSGPTPNDAAMRPRQANAGEACLAHTDTSTYSLETKKGPRRVVVPSPIDWDADAIA
jgi:hypothetical protein